VILLILMVVTVSRHVTPLSLVEVSGDRTASALFKQKSNFKPRRQAKHRICVCYNHNVLNNSYYILLSRVRMALDGGLY
jgi:hypothetical protein